MSKIALTPNASGTGTFTLAAPNSNTSRTITLPDEAGEVLVNGTNQNVGIGTGSPTRQLDVSKAGTAYIRASDTSSSVNMEMLAASSGGWVGTQTNHSLNFQTNNAERMRINSSGNVGIGTSSPSSPLTVSASATTVGQFISSNSSSYVEIDNSGGGGYIGTSGNNMLFLTSTSGTERMRIDSSGNVSIGETSNPGYRLSLKATGTVQLINRTGSDGVLILFQNDGASVGSISMSGSSTAYNTSSDYRLKTDAQPMTGASARVQALNPVNFEWLSDGTRVDGFLAHEAQAIVPEAVTGTKDAMMDEEYEVTPAVYEDVVIPAVLDDEGNELEAERTEQQLVTEAVMGTRSVPDYQGIDQSKLVPLLTAALQEALTEISDLKARVTALEAV